MVNPGRNAARQVTELSALNKVIKRLQELKLQVTASGSASLAEQQAQTALLTTIDTNIADIEVLLAKGNLQILEQEATDLVKTFAYAGSSGAYRVDTITYTSPGDFPAITVVKTFVYLDAGTADERVSTITLS